MKNIEIYFFSGTGNAKRIALWISHEAQKENIPCHLHNIGSGPHPAPSPDSTIIFISPVHGFNYPKITLDFIRKFPPGTNEVILMNTRAGMKLGNWVTPGLTGIGFYLSAFWLKGKGYKIVGQIPYDMPSNWLLLHPALKTKASYFIHEKIKERVVRHFEILKNNKPLFISNQEIVQDVLIAPISMLYYFFGRFFLAKTFYASDKCDNCGICIKECPVNAIIEVNGRPYWTIHCESCMHCMNYCPEKAIETSHGLVAFTILAYIFSVTNLQHLFPAIKHLGFITEFVLKNLIFLAIVIVFYYLQQWLLRFSFFAKIITGLSFSYYKFWGRYKSIFSEKNNKK